MSQFGFFDADRRLSVLSLKGDPLVEILALVPWEKFRTDIETVVLTAAGSKKSPAGRKPIDALALFRMLVLQSLYNLSDEQIEYQVRDRLSFTRFLGLGFEDGIPDGTTLWLFREKLAKAGLIDRLFERFGRHLEAKGYIARGGQMVDATIVPVPRQRNSRDENDQVKTGATPEDWKKRPSKNRQKDKDARWTKKHGRSYFGYKNHVNADVVGYSRLMGRDENGTLARLKAHRTERLEPLLARHGGRLVKLTGDGALVEFPVPLTRLLSAWPPLRIAGVGSLVRGGCLTCCLPRGWSVRCPLAFPLGGLRRRGLGAFVGFPAGTGRCGGGGGTAAGASPSAMSRSNSAARSPPLSVFVPSRCVRVSGSAASRLDSSSVSSTARKRNNNSGLWSSRAPTP